jgi:hypothetical protein
VLNISTYHDLPVAAPESVTVTRIARAVLGYWLFPWNYYHMLAEYLPTLHNHLCKYWKDCDHDPHSDLHILLRNYHLRKGIAAPEAVSAITAEPITSIWGLGEGDPTTEVLLIDKMLVGVGIECRMDHLHCRGQWRGKEWKPELMRPPSKDSMLSWQKRLSSIVPFDVDKQAAIDPTNLVLINRRQDKARSILNIEELMRAFWQRWPHMHVQLAYLEEMSVPEQAALYNNASIAIWGHGASMANLIYMPNGAMGMQIVPRLTNPELFAWPEDYVEDLPNQVHLFHFNITDPSQTPFYKAEFVHNDPVYQMLNDEEKHLVNEHKQCPGRLGTITGDPRQPEYCEEFWFKLNVQMLVDVDAICNSVQHMVDQLEHQAAISS